MQLTQDYISLDTTINWVHQHTRLVIVSLRCCENVNWSSNTFGWWSSSTTDVTHQSQQWRKRKGKCIFVSMHSSYETVSDVYEHEIHIKRQYYCWPYWSLVTRCVNWALQPSLAQSAAHRTSSVVTDLSSLCKIFFFFFFQTTPRVFNSLTFTALQIYI